MEIPQIVKDILEITLMAVMPFIVGAVIFTPIYLAVSI